MNSDRFDELTAALLDGSINEADRAELLDAAAQDRARGAQLLELLRLEPLLRDSLGQESASAGFPQRIRSALSNAGDTHYFTSAVIAKLKAHDVAGSAATNADAVRPKVLIAPRRRWMPVLLAAAVSVAVLGIVLRFFFVSGGESVEVEILSGSAFVTDGGRETEIQSRQKMTYGQGLRCAQGSARILFPDGSSAQIAEGGVVRHIANAHEGQRGPTVVLAEGELTADVKPQPNGAAFRVVTGSAVVRVIGTRFTVVGGNESTRLQVHEGTVELKRAADGAHVDVAAGFVAVAAPNTELTAIPASKVSELVGAKDGRAITAASYLGGPGSDAVVGAAIQKDGTVLLAANLSPSALSAITPILLNGAGADSEGALLRLSSTGRTVLSISRVSSVVNDLAMDGAGNLYLAAGSEGVIKLNPSANKVEWTRATDLPCVRLDAGADGSVAALLKADKNPTRVMLLRPDGAPGATVSPPHAVNDVALDAVNGRVFICGARSGNTARGGIGSVATLIAYQMDGREAWRNYSFDPGMKTELTSHTTGERIAIGGDGKLYGSFLSVGGNHIFSRDPKSLDIPVRLAASDPYNQAYATGHVYISFVGRFDPLSGDLLAGQLLLGRDEKKKATHATPVGGAICADEDGRVYLAGKADAGGPRTPDAVGGSSYKGQEGFLCIFSPDLQSREFYSTFNASAEGGSALQAVAARRIPGLSRAAFAVGGNLLEQAGGMQLNDAIQSVRSKSSEGFFAVRGAAVPSTR